MREIKFRGKRTGRIKGNEYRSNYQNGDFVFGLLTKHEFVFGNDKLNAEMTDINGISGIEVDESTIGQFTGLYDKNGKEVYEGDIVALNKFLLGCYVVKYDIKNARFSMYCDNYEQAGFNLETMKNYEVIGNIYDNPELLK